MDSRSLICCFIPPLTTKVRINSLQYLIIMQWATVGQIPNWVECDIHPPKEPMSSSAQHTHIWANDDQEHSLLAHATVCPVPAHVPCRASHRAYTLNEPHVRSPDPHAPVATKVGSDTICNAPESKRLRSTLHAERTTTYHQPTYVFVLALRRRINLGWWDEL
jgi:hypothetical protein